MSDIVIRGMEMPKGNDYLHLIIQNGKVHTAISCGYVSTDELNIAEAIELPPHGRLGDLDSVEEWMRNKHKEHDCPFNIDAFLFALRKFPTILEANE